MNARDPQERLCELSDMLQSAVEHAMLLQQQAGTSHQRMRDAADALKRATTDFPPIVGAVVRGQLEAAVDAAAKRMTEKWTDANEAASTATAIFQKAETFLSWTLLAKLGALFFAVVLLLVGAAVYLTPTALEIRGLRAEREQLQGNIEQLRRAGAGAQFSNCNDSGRQRTCVRVNPKAPEFQNDYKVLFGH